MEDLDSEVVLSYAEIKAVATGNPLIREHAEVSADVARLSRLSDNHARAQRSLPGRLQSMRERIRSLDDTIDRLQRLVDRSVDTRGDLFAFTTVDGVTFDERVAAGEWLRDRLTRLTPARNGWTPLGALGGADYEATRWMGSTGTRLELRIVDDTDALAFDAHDLWNASPHGLMVRLERLLERVPERLAAAGRDRDVTVEQLRRGEATLGQPFPHTAALTTARHRLAALNEELSRIDPPADPSPPPVVERPAGPDLTV